MAKFCIWEDKMSSIHLLCLMFKLFGLPNTSWVTLSYQQWRRWKTIGKVGLIGMFSWFYTMGIKFCIFLYRCMKAMQARDIPACIKFQGDYIQDMIDESGYIHNVTHKILNEWFENRLKSGVCGYRNYSHTSIFTQRQGVKPKVNFMENRNHDLQSFLKMYSS